MIEKGSVIRTLVDLKLQKQLIDHWDEKFSKQYVNRKTKKHQKLMNGIDCQTDICVKMQNIN